MQPARPPGVWDGTGLEPLSLRWQGTQNRGLVPFTARDVDENRIYDGALAVVDVNDESTVTFTARGIDLQELLDNLTKIWRVLRACTR